MKQTISKDLKEQILARVREGKDTVATIARDHAVHANTIYGWISREGMTAGSPLPELSRAKKEILFLKQIIGNLVENLERGKKGGHR